MRNRLEETYKGRMSFAEEHQLLVEAPDRIRVLHLVFNIPTLFVLVVDTKPWLDVWFTEARILVTGPLSYVSLGLNMPSKCYSPAWALEHCRVTLCVPEPSSHLCHRPRPASSFLPVRCSCVSLVWTHLEVLGILVIPIQGLNVLVVLDVPVCRSRST